MVDIVSYNVRGIANWNKRAKILKFLRDNIFNVIFLQETHSTRKCEKVWKTQFGGQIFYSHGESNACGCAIMINPFTSDQFTYLSNAKLIKWVYLLKKSPKFQYV